MRDQLQMRRQEKQKTSLEAAPSLSDQLVRRQLAQAAGTEMFQHRDISYHLTENFCQTFDRTGQQKAMRALAEVPGLEEKNGLKLRPGSGLRENIPGLEHQPVSAAPQGRQGMQDAYRTRPGGEETLQRFADIAFQRGRLSAAILQGTGKMMLFSCLRRAAGQQKSLSRGERMLFQASSTHKRSPQGQGVITVTNKGLAKSAVGLVVDTLQDSRQSLLSMIALAEAGGPGAETLRREYPFLTNEREQTLLAEYRARLAELKGPGCEQERQVLLAAEEKALHQLQQKEQMKERFLQKLRQLADQALQAQLLFSQTETQQEAAQAIAVQSEKAGPSSPPHGEGSSSEPPEPPAGEDADGDGESPDPAAPGAKGRKGRKRAGAARPADAGRANAPDAAHPAAGRSRPAGRPDAASTGTDPDAGVSTRERGNGPALGGWAAALAGGAFAAALIRDEERDDAGAGAEPDHDGGADAQHRPGDDPSGE